MTRRPVNTTATLTWKEGQKPTSIRINGNEVADTFGTGTLIVRYVENIDGAVSGDSTYELLAEEPTETVTHAVAIAKGSTPKFYTNDDTDREVDAAGIQLLDDKLLIDEDGTDRQELLEEKAVDSGLLKDLGAEQAYRYEFHYLDLVDAFNGNAWVSASYGTTVYLPYPAGVTAGHCERSWRPGHPLPRPAPGSTAFAGQAEVEEAIEACKPETMEVEYDANGIKFDVSKAGFSPFAGCLAGGRADLHHHCFRRYRRFHQSQRQRFCG